MSQSSVLAVEEKKEKPRRHSSQKKSGRKEGERWVVKMKGF